VAVERQKIEIKFDKNKTIGEKLDYFFNKMIPKKLLVWVVATVIIFVVKDPDGKHWMSGEMWGYITLAYLGVNAVKGFATNGRTPFRKQRREEEDNR